MKKLINYIFVTLILTSCVKHMNREVIVEGRLMSSCSTPAANTTGSFHYTSGMSWEEWAKFTTDENGYFKVKKQIEGSTIDLYVGSQVLRNIKLSQKDHVDLGEVYIFPPSVSYYLYLEVDSAYTENDTLSYYDWGYPQNGGEHWEKKLAGPFSSGIIDTVHNAVNLGALPLSFESSTDPKIKLNYYMNDYDSWTDDDKYIYISTPHCVEEYQNVTLKIE